MTISEYPKTSYFELKVILTFPFHEGMYAGDDDELKMEYKNMQINYDWM